ncbi:hypothetical protein [uncultured Hoeflea sp.]|uniref:hypothetical protein n=1 Tax=uncultured Hoeflea sp. TaxID=538666 RepID=UPI0030D78D60|tara:strand:- start:14425 stop:14616 length:192 start_codon:yes stop_codon:yes gene_type:complete
MITLELTGIERHYLVLAIAHAHLESLKEAAALRDVSGKESEAKRATNRYLRFEELLAKVHRSG